jgi:hypothetical protein
MVRSSRKFEVQLTLERLSKIVRFPPPISGQLIRSRGLRPDSAKTYGNLVHGTACRKTDEFPGPAAAALIGRLMGIPKNV